MPNFVAFAASVAELAHGEKSRTQSLTHPAYLMARKLKLSLRNITVEGGSRQQCILTVKIRGQYMSLVADAPPFLSMFYDIIPQ